MARKPGTEHVFRFGVAGDGNQCLISGWATPENGFVWSDGKHARIEIPITGNVSSCRLSIWGYVLKGGGAQEVTIFIDGKFSGYFEVSDKIICDPHIRRHSSGPLVLDLLIPTATRPSDNEGNDDRRRLGIALAAIMVLD
jgi:hypothetical protein